MCSGQAVNSNRYYSQSGIMNASLKLASRLADIIIRLWRLDRTPPHYGMMLFKVCNAAVLTDFLIIYLVNFEMNCHALSQV